MTTLQMSRLDAWVTIAILYKATQPSTVYSLTVITLDKFFFLHLLQLLYWS